MSITEPDYTNLPDIVTTQGGQPAAVQLATIRNIQFIIDESGLEPRLNISTAGVDWFIWGEPVEANQAHQENAELLFLDLCTYCRIKQRDQVREIINNLAKANPFNPMEDWLKSLEDDGEDHIAALAASVKTDNPLWPTYLENWLIQTVEGVCGWRDRQEKKSLPHVMTLVGGQGVGKSRWLKMVGGKWFKGEAELHLSSPSGKDHQIAALRLPMVELAELDGIFRKADVSHMKSFISREEDEIRAPYERRALVRPRMTSFCASVNDAEFLNDPTGSRRFWPVLVESIDWSFQVNFEGLWAQAYAYWLDDPDFNLTAEEDAMRAKIATDVHFTESDESETIREYLRLHERNDRFPVIAMSALDVLKMLYGRQRNFNNKQKADASRVLHDKYGKHRTIDGKQRAWMLPYNEFAADKATWPDKISLK